jgi:hypothetical protein
MRISLYPSVAVVMKIVCVSSKVHIMMYDAAIVFWLQVSRSSEHVWLGNVLLTVRVPVAVRVKGLWWTAQRGD